MQISNGLEALDLAAYFPDSKTLAVADLHLGYEEMLNKQGIMVPRFNFRGIKERFEKRIFPKTGKVSRMIIAGDLKHEFGIISQQEWREVLDMLDFLKGICEEIILVRGNHDTILGPIADKKGILAKEDFFVPDEKTLFIHGDKIPSKGLLKKCERVVIGHEHPAVSVRDGSKTETYKCFLKGKYKGKELIVMPSMNSVSLGSDVTKEETLSPLIGKSGNFEVFAVEDDIYWLGKLGNLIQK